MKKIFILLLCLTLINVGTSAQIRFGVKGGANLTKLSFSGNDHYSIDNYMGFSLGPIVKFSLPVKGLYVDVAALYDYRNAKVSSPGLVGGAIYKSAIKQHQIVIPINFRYGLELSNFEPYIFAGPQIGFGICNEKVEMDYGNWNPNKTNCSINVGIGTIFNDNWQISLEYNIACGENADIGINDNEVIYGGKMSAIQLCLGYYF
jgi:hypothetical protein